MNSRQTQELCLSLLKADTEQDVIGLLKAAGFWDSPEVWRYYGDAENNFSVIGNQQSRPDAAIVEKLVNSIDHCLINACLESRINPEGLDAPPSILEAVASFFGGNGKIAEWPTAKRTKVARSITLAATGYGPREGTRRPCFTISDAGEGQTPAMMPNTLLSLMRSNKLRIPFVQGKYNMGSTGVLPFCGECGLQLILTRRNPKLVSNPPDHPTDHMWSFTIVRREDPSGSQKHSTTTYLAPLAAKENVGKGGVLRFSADSLPLFPDGRDAYTRHARWGTAVKLYEYTATGYSNSNILMKDGLLARLDLLLPDVALPVRLHECRSTYAGHSGSFETTLTGLGVRLEDNKGDNLEPGFPSSCPLGACGESMTATIFAFKKDRAETYRKNEGIIFTLNGQTHGHMTLGFFSQKNVGLSYLSDSILVLVDCSKISGAAREKLFMPSRDRLRNNNLKEELEQALEDMLKNHEGLRELKNRRRDEELASRLEDSKPLEDILQNLLKTSPTLANFFMRGNRASNPFKTIKVKAKQVEYRGKQFPTYFKLKGKDYGQQLEKECHINLRCRVTFETDVVNDYFSRRLDPGEFNLYLISGNNRQPATTFVGPNLANGIATLSVRLPDNCREGDLLTFVAVVSDPIRLEPFENTFTVRVIEPHKPRGKPGTRRNPPTNEEGEERDLPSGIAMPNITKVKEEKWASCSPPFNKYTALVIKHADTEGEGEDEIDIYDFYVNVDNVYLKSEMKVASVDERIVEGQFIYGMVLIGLALLQQKAIEAKRHAQVQKAGDVIESGESANGVEDQVATITKAVAPVLLPMIESLGQLDVDAVSAMTASGESV